MNCQYVRCMFRIYKQDQRENKVIYTYRTLDRGKASSDGLSCAFEFHQHLHAVDASQISAPTFDEAKVYVCNIFTHEDQP